MWKMSQHSLTSIIRSSAQRRFSVNNKCLIIAARCSTALFRFGVVSSRIPKYLKVYTCLVMSPLNTNSWHGLIKLNTMIFFFTFTISPRSTQNCWSVSNCCCNPTFDSVVRARLSAKNNNHMCTFVRAGASHSLSSKRPSQGIQI